VKNVIPDRDIDCLITIDWHGEIIDFNPAAGHEFGQDRLEAMGQRLLNLVSPTALCNRNRRWSDVFRNLLKDAGPIPGPRFEVIATRADHSEFRADMSLCRLPIEAARLFAVRFRNIAPTVSPSPA
jgi:PAS domain-containing protein